MKKVIAFSLWGKIRLYCIGAIKNALLAKIYFPDWICRFYYDNSVPNEIINYLKTMENVELEFVEIPSGGTLFKDNGQFGMFWRFYPFNDDDVEIWMARDIDSRISRYEVNYINEFLKSNKILHTFSDTSEKLCRGGATSFKNYCNGIDTRNINNQKLNIHDLIGNINKKKCPFRSDENFLNNTLAKIYNEHIMRNDRVKHSEPEFFDKEITGSYVGEVLDEYDININKNKIRSFNYKTNYDDLEQLLEDYKTKINS